MVGNRERFLELVRDPSQLEQEDLSTLQELTKNYPWFQAAAAIQTRLLRDLNSPQFKDELARTACLTSDRGVLMQAIAGRHKRKSDQPPHVEVHKQPPAETSPTEEDSSKNADGSDHTEEVRETSLEHKEVKENEKHSFTEWLKLTSLKPIHRSGDKGGEGNDENIAFAKAKSQEKTAGNKNGFTDQQKKFDLIDKFLADTSKKIKPSKKSEAPKTQPSSYSPEQLMTETLAQMYLSQNNYDKAIQAYEILILKNPDKSGFFADRIREIRKLQKNS